MNKSKLVIYIACFALIFTGILFLLKPDKEINNSNSNQHVIDVLDTNKTDSTITDAEETVIAKTPSNNEDIDKEASPQEESLPEGSQPSSESNERSTEVGETQEEQNLYVKEANLRDVIYKKMEEHPNITIDEVSCQKEECQLKYTSYDQFNRDVTNEILKEYIDLYGENVQLKNVLEKNGASSVEIVIKN